MEYDRTNVIAGSRPKPKCETFLTVPTGYATVDPFAVGEYAEFDQILTEGMRIYKFLNAHPKEFSYRWARDALRNLNFVRELVGDRFTDMTRFEVPPWGTDFDWGHIRPPEGMLDFGSEWFGPGDLEGALGNIGLAYYLGVAAFLAASMIGGDVGLAIQLLIIGFFLGIFDFGNITVPPYDYMVERLEESGAPKNFIQAFREAFQR